MPRNDRFGVRDSARSAALRHAPDAGVSDDDGDACANDRGAATDDDGDAWANDHPQHPATDDDGAWTDHHSGRHGPTDQCTGSTTTERHPACDCPAAVGRGGRGV